MMRSKDKCALTPPMGWNSWDCYAAAVTEEQVLQNAEYMWKNLLSHGWEYVVCDIQ
jgi:alpha-galactosidase